MATITQKIEKKIEISLSVINNTPADSATYGKKKNAVATACTEKTFSKTLHIYTLLWTHVPNFKLIAQKLKK